MRGPAGAAGVRTWPVDAGTLDLRGPGEALPPAVRERMEHYFRQDFGNVRVHFGAEASRIGAVGFTLGESIWFAREHRGLAGPRSLQLLGHELTHVVQQRQRRVPMPQGPGLVVVQDPTLEREADLNAQRCLLASSASGGRRLPPSPFATRGAQPRLDGAPYARQVLRMEADTSTAKSEPSAPDDEVIFDAVLKLMKEKTTPFTAAGLGAVDVDHFTLAQPSDASVDRLKQNAKHLCATLLQMAKDHRIKDDEIQVMSIGQTHIFCSNNPESMRHWHADISKMTKDGLVAAFQQHLENLVSRVNVDNKKIKDKHQLAKAIKKLGRYDQVRFCAKLLRAFEDSSKRAPHGLLDELSSLTNDAALKDLVTHATKPAAAAKAVKPDKFRLIFLEPQANVHSEQNFILMLLKNRALCDNDISIYGSKRPCYMCGAALTLAREKLFKRKQLSFNTHFGQFWQTACESFSITAAAMVKANVMKGDEVNDWFTSFQKNNPEMHFSKRKKPEGVEKPEEWGEPTLTTKRKKVTLSNTAGGNYQSDSESDLSEDELLEWTGKKIKKARADGEARCLRRGSVTCTPAR